jgi:hypothetical protein
MSTLRRFVNKFKGAPAPAQQYGQYGTTGGWQSGYNDPNFNYLSGQQGFVGGQTLGSDLGGQSYGSNSSLGMQQGGLGATNLATGTSLGQGGLGQGGFSQGLGTSAFGGSNLGSAELSQGQYGNTSCSCGVGPSCTTCMPTSQSCGGCVATYEKPAVIQEVMHRSVVEEVQPIIQREREQTEIHQIIAPLYQREDRPAIVTERCLPAETRPVIFNAPTQEFQQQYESALPRAAVQEIPSEPQRQVLPPIIKEVIKKNIVEEIHPVLHKQIYQPEIIKQTLPIYEKIVEPPILVREERAAFQLGSGQFLPKFGQATSTGLAGSTVLDVDVKRSV